MKILYVLLIFISFFIGCSSTYKVSDFSSKDKFYEDFNNFAKDKSIKVILTNDSSFITTQGSFISNDSLVFATIVQNEKTIDKSEIKEIKYSGPDMSNLSGRIILKNGDSAITKNNVFNSDSSITAKVFESKNGFLPITEIRKLSYKNRLLGFGTDFLLGIPVGFVCGVTVAIMTLDTGTQKGGDKASFYYCYGLITGSIVGGIIGTIIGYNYTYIITP